MSPVARSFSPLAVFVGLVTLVAAQSNTTTPAPGTTTAAPAPTSPAPGTTQAPVTTPAPAPAPPPGGGTLTYPATPLASKGPYAYPSGIVRCFFFDFFFFRFDSMYSLCVAR